MTGEGTIFSDGVEADFISFNAGATAHVRTAKQQARLVSAQSATDFVARGVNLSHALRH
jgi:hypothetical protein